MRVMRDFFYNKGDVLIAVLIILIAAFVIYMRVGVIMDYSEAGGGNLLPNPLAALGSDDGDDDDGDDDGDGNNSDGLGDDGLPFGGDEPASGDDDDGVTAAEEPPAEIPPEDLQMDEPEPEPPTPAPAAQDAQITVNAGDTGGAIADKLITAGLITDKQGWISDLIASGADTKVKQGTFKIPAGSSHSEIIAILTR